jgi:hypothetical protein
MINLKFLDYGELCNYGMRWRFPNVWASRDKTKLKISSWTV